MMAWFASSIPVVAHAQTVGSLSGRVLVAASSEGIPNALVELVGQGAMLSSSDGSFRFARVPLGDYRLRVRAFGYVAFDGDVVVDGDTRIAAELTPDPLPIDSLVVELASIDVPGRVRDALSGISLMNVEVLVNHQPVTISSPRGRFTAKDLWAGVPILLSLRFFGYLPVDTVVTPMEDHDYTFELALDSLVQSLIARQMDQLQSRMGGYRAILMPPIDRERLLRWSGVTLWEVLAGTYPTRWGRVSCVVVDEEVVPQMIRRNVLQTMLPGEVERMEFLHDGSMLRIYTRDFVRNMVAGVAELQSALSRDCV